MKMTTEQENYVREHIKNLKNLYVDNIDFFETLALDNYDIRMGQIAATVLAWSLLVDEIARS